MRHIHRIQTLFAWLSLPALLGWVIITFMPVSYIPVLFNVMMNAESFYSFANALAGIAGSLLVVMLGWWGWYSLFWVWFFYRRSRGVLPRHIYWGNVAGACIAVSLLIDMWPDFYLTHPDSSGVDLPLIILALLYMAPLFLLLANVAQIRIGVEPQTGSLG